MMSPIWSNSNSKASATVDEYSGGVILLEVRYVNGETLHREFDNINDAIIVGVMLTREDES